MAFIEDKTNKECSYLCGFDGMEENKKSAPPKITASIAHRAVSCSLTSGRISFLGVFRSH